MQVRSIDPRDATWHDWSPAYRVYFFTTPGQAPEAQGEAPAISAEEFEVSGADIAEVLQWAEGRAKQPGGYVVYVVVTTPDGKGLVRLAGEDPTLAPPPLSGQEPPR